LDFHVGPRLDQTCLLNRLGQRPKLLGPKIFGSSHTEDPRVGTPLNRLSNYYKRFAGQGNAVLEKDMMEENFNFYKNDKDFANVDLVVCSYLAQTCEGFIPLNKTILFNPSQRYNIGRCQRDNWLKWNENIFKAIKRSKMIVSGMSVYELEYTAHYTGVRNQYQLFGYGGFYTDNVAYSPLREEILVGTAFSVFSFPNKGWGIKNDVFFPDQLENNVSCSDRKY
jgi:hypothetical protein